MPDWLMRRDSDLGLAQHHPLEQGPKQWPIVQSYIPSGSHRYDQVHAMEECLGNLQKLPPKQGNMTMFLVQAGKTLGSSKD